MSGCDTGFMVQHTICIKETKIDLFILIFYFIYLLDGCLLVTSLCSKKVHLKLSEVFCTICSSCMIFQTTHGSDLWGKSLICCRGSAVVNLQWLLCIRSNVQYMPLSLAYSEHAPLVPPTTIHFLL